MATRAFLLTDIEGSTRLWATTPAEMRAALAHHDDAVSTAVASAGGSVFKHTGDGMFAVFDAPASAVAAAVAAQRDLLNRGGKVTLPRVRMAIHAGEAEPRDGDWFGPALNRTARLLGLAYPGQVLATDLVHGLLADVPLGPVGLSDLGVHQLRDLPAPERVWQVVAPGLERTFPNPPSPPARGGNLPVQLTSFVGRDTERHELLELVRRHRLVCVTGAGGMGKTRLALAVGVEAVREFSDGVWLVQLAPVDRGEVVDSAVMAGLGVVPGPGLSPREAIVRAVAARHLLVIVDNCEHVVDAAAGLIGELLAAAPHVHVVVTTRQPLGLPGEWTFTLSPLSVEDQVELFQERAAAVRGGRRLDDERVAAICGRLDGMPLAIELAAARLSSMSLVELDGHLDERFRLLVRRGGDPRHSTLQAVVDWSFSQLDAELQEVFCRLSVFAGDFPLDSAAAVTGLDDELAALDRLDALVQRSLVVVAERDGRTSYRLLETLRDYGRARLAAEDLAATLRRHAEHYSVVVARCIRSLRGGDDDAAIAGLRGAWDNIRAAVGAAFELVDVDLAFRLVTPLAAFMTIQPDREVAGWARGALALPGGDGHPQALYAHLLLSQVSYTHLDLLTAEEHARKALRIIEAHQLRPLPRAEFALGYALAFQGRYAEGMAAFRRAADVAADQGRLMDRIQGLHDLIIQAAFGGERWADEVAAELVELRAVATASRARAMAAAALGVAAIVEGRGDAAVLLREAATLSTTCAMDVVESAYHGWARLAEAGKSPRAQLVGLVDVVQIYERTQLPFALRCILHQFLPALAALGRHRAVAILDGAGTPTTILPDETERARGEVRLALDGDEYERLVEQGRRMTTDEVLAVVRQELAVLQIEAQGDLDLRSPGADRSYPQPKLLPS